MRVSGIARLGDPAAPASEPGPFARPSARVWAASLPSRYGSPPRPNTRPSKGRFLPTPGVQPHGRLAGRRCGALLWIKAAASPPGHMAECPRPPSRVGVPSPVLRGRASRRWRRHRHEKPNAHASPRPRGKRAARSGAGDGPVARCGTELHRADRRATSPLWRRMPEKWRPPLVLQAGPDLLAGLQHIPAAQALPRPATVAARSSGTDTPPCRRMALSRAPSLDL